MYGMDTIFKKPEPVNDVFKEFSDFFRNTDKSVEGTKEMVDKLNKNFDMAFPYLVIGGVLFAIALITQSSKNIQEIAINNKKLK